MTEYGSGSDCEECNRKGQTFPTKVKIVRRIRYIKIPISSRIAGGKLCHNCGHFEEGDYDGDS